MKTNGYNLQDIKQHNKRQEYQPQEDIPQRPMTRKQRLNFAFLNGNPVPLDKELNKGRPKRGMFGDANMDNVLY